MKVQLLQFQFVPKKMFGENLTYTVSLDLTYTVSLDLNCPKKLSKFAPTNVGHIERIFPAAKDFPLRFSKGFEKDSTKLQKVS